jgi:hypothetical protein
MRKQMMGTLRETEPHAALKQYYARPADRLEVKVDGYVIDLVRDDELIEIQTHNFAALKRKLLTLLSRHRVQLVDPIAQAKWIARVKADQQTVLGRRKPCSTPSNRPVSVKHCNEFRRSSALLLNWLIGVDLPSERLPRTVTLHSAPSRPSRVWACKD